MSDLRDAARALKASPVVTTVAVLSLALGIGANTAIFSILHSLILRALPVRDPHRLVLVGQNQNRSWTNPIWEQIRDRQGLFGGALASWNTRFNLAEGGQTEFVDGLWASGGYFDVLGVSPILGRTFRVADDRRGGGPDGPVTVISYGFWQRRFGGSVDVIGRSLTIERVPFTIIGVMPPGFFGTEVGRTFDVAIPLGTEPLIRGQESVLDRRSNWWLNIMLRLEAGQTVESATATLAGLQPLIREATIPEHYREQDKARYLQAPLTLQPAATGNSPLRNRYQRPLTTNSLVQERIVAMLSGFFGVLALLLAGLGLHGVTSYSVSRRRTEIGIRMALGAAPGGVVRMVLGRVGLLVGFGVLAGGAITFWASRLVETLLYGLTPRDPGTVAGAIVLLAAIGMAAGWVPARRAARIDPTRTLREG